MLLREIISGYFPEPWGDVKETWDEYFVRLWKTQGDYLAAMYTYMETINSWFWGPVDLQGDHVRNGGHRLICAQMLGWLDREIPVKFKDAHE